MACGRCGQPADTHKGEIKEIYVAGQGWVRCKGYELPDLVTPAVSSNGGATRKKLYLDTKAFRDRSVKDAAAKARKV